MFLLMRLGSNSTKKRKNEVKIKNQTTFFKPNNFKKKHKYNTHKIFMKTHLVHQTKHQLRQNISRNVIFEVQ